MNFRFISCRNHKKKRKEKKMAPKKCPRPGGVSPSLPLIRAPDNTNTHTRARTHTERETRGGTHALAHARDHVRGVQVRY